MRLRSAALVLAVLAWSANSALATPYGENDDDEFHLTTPVRGIFFGSAGHARAERAMQTDLKFARNMSRHHQGAVDMATAYLGDARGTNPIIRRLAQAIIRNQAFEIDLLEVVEKDVARGPQPVPGMPGAVWLARGWEGLEHEWQFVKSPSPSALDLWLTPGLQVSDFDVQFARPMIQHHSAAIEMAMAYNRNPDGGNSLLGSMNYDIMQDQRAEISLLRRLIARYAGDPGAVKDDPNMMKMMHRSMPGMAMNAAEPGAPSHQDHHR